MRLVLLLISGILVLAAGIGTRAEAQNYPWCAQYSTRDGATCGFTSFEQCMATVSGIGGFCIQNWDYPPPATPTNRAAKRYPY
jgi:hypothetical protein